MKDPLDDAPEPLEESLTDDGGEGGSSRLVVPALVLVILVALGSVGWNLYGKHMTSRAEAAGVNAQSEPAPTAVGNPDALVKLEVCLGPAYGALMGELAALAGRWPEQVRAEFYSYFSPEGQAFAREHGRDLACIFINGVGDVQVGAEGEEQTVVLHGPPGDTYTTAHVLSLLRQTLEEVHGALPDGFDEAAEQLLDNAGDPGETR